MAWTKTRSAIIAAVGLVAVVTPIILQYRENARLQQQLALAREENARLLSDQQSAQTSQAAAEARNEKLRNLQAEVMRLRARVAQLASATPPKNATAKSASITTSQTGERDDEATAPFTIALTNRVAVGQTLVAGGWSRTPGKRIFMLTTPEIQNGGDATNSMTVGLNYAIVEAPDEFWDGIGWTSLTTDSHQSGGLATLDPEQGKTVLEAMKTAPDSEILSSPRITTADGMSASIHIGGEDSNDDLSGGSISIDVTPHLDPNGQFVDLELHSQITPLQK